MTTGARRWTVRLTAAAESGFREILRWTRDEFGDAQASVYAETLSTALKDLDFGPSVVGTQKRDDIAKGLFALHVARKRRKGRHFVMFRIGRDEGSDVIEVLRILHDSMDLPRRLPRGHENS